MTIYRNLTPNITKGQKRVKKGSKKGKKKVKIKNAHRNTIYECNFWHVYTIYIYTYDISIGFFNFYHFFYLFWTLF